MIPDATPVLVGVGTAAQREPDPARAAEAVELMGRSLEAAGQDSGRPELLTRIGDLAVPRGRWGYGDPGRLLADRVGATGAHTVRADVGILQQTLIARACTRVASGAVEVAAVVGGEAGHRLRQAEKAGTTAAESPAPDEPDELLVPQQELRLPVERTAGLRAAVGYYAVLESAFRHRRGWTVERSRDLIAELYARMSEQSLDNPGAWRPERVAAREIRDAGEGNPMLAFPYTRRHATSWSVDQAGALLVCSAGTARRLGVPQDRWVFPMVSAESNHMRAVSRRDDLSRSPGAVHVARAVLDRAADGIDLVDLYSCFPVAVELFAEAFGLGTDRPLTVTGGMPWAGGPYNNYVVQATCRTIELIRAGQGRTGLVTCVSGLMTKQAAALWSDRPPRDPFAAVDVTAAVAAEAQVRDVVADHTGPGTVAGYTVLHERDAPARGVAVLDLPGGLRTVVRAADQGVVSAMESDEWCGRAVTVRDGILRGSGT